MAWRADFQFVSTLDIERPKMCVCVCVCVCVFVRVSVCVMWVGKVLCCVSILEGDGCDQYCFPSFFLRNLMFLG